MTDKKKIDNRETGDQDLHSLLIRQLKKYYNKTGLTELPVETQQFAEAVNTAYMQFDEDREMLERSMELSSMELLQANSELQTLFLAMPDIFFRIETDGTICDYKAGTDKEFLLPPAQLVGRRLQDIPDKLISAKFQEAIRFALGKQEIIPVEYNLEIEGNVLYYEARFIPFMSKEIIVIVRNITGRKEAEEALAAEKERLSVTLRSIGDGVITTDTSGNVLMVNQVAEQLTGWTQEEARGKPLDRVIRIIKHSTRERQDNIVEEITKSGQTLKKESNTILISRDGTERFIAHTGSPIIDQGKIVGVVLAIRDITARRKMEEDLLRAQKLESIGVLAGGIAHDFNNILTAVMGNITLAKRHIGESHKLLKRLDNAEKAANRTRDLIQRLVTFATGGAPIRRTIDIHELLRHSIEFTLAGSNVKPEFAIAPGLWPVDIDENQFAQAINNLVLNAVEAMPNGGTLNVLAENVTHDTKGDAHPDSGDYIKVTIQDTGVGISPLHMSKIFDPYFSTKEKGSGLGLTSSYSIIKKHNGHIEVESYLNEGTTVRLFIPVSRKEWELKESDLEYKKDARILVMDDNPHVIETAGDILKEEGFRVTFALDGKETIDKYMKAQKANDPFDLVIMDLTIPGGMGGKEAVEKLKKKDPEAKVIASSGYSNDPVMAYYHRYGFAAVVSKPYVASSLLQAVKRVLSH